jgi:ABC-type uncharacterized transport system permease subunit
MILSGVSQAWFGLLAFLALLAYLLLVFKSHTTKPLHGMSLTGAWLFHGLSLYIVISLGRFGFGSALSVTAWLVLCIYMLESRWYPAVSVRRPLAAMGALALIVGVIFPGAVLAHQAPGLLALHAALGMASYGLMGAACVHAWLMNRSEAAMRHTALSAQPTQSLPLMTLERLMLTFVVAAFVLLSATLLAGWWFGEALYGAGKAWSWNHKSIFSVASWVVLAALLLGRWQSGWRGRKASRWVYIASALLLLAYVGSRFVLEIFLGRV